MDRNFLVFFVFGNIKALGDIFRFNWSEIGGQVGEPDNKIENHNRK